MPLADTRKRNRLSNSVLAPRLIEIRIDLPEGHPRDRPGVILLPDARLGLLELGGPYAVRQGEVGLQKRGKTVCGLDQLPVPRVARVLIEMRADLAARLLHPLPAAGDHALELDLREEPYLLVPGLLYEAVDLLLHPLPLIRLDQAVEAAHGLLHRVDDVPGEDFGQV